MVAETRGGIMKKSSSLLKVLVFVPVLCLCACTEKTILVKNEQDHLAQVTPTEEVSMDSGNISRQDSGEPSSDFEEEFGDITWVSYKNADEGFNLKYPDGYALEENVSNLGDVNPEPAYEVAFFNSEDAIGVQPATLVVRVYKPPKKSEIESWLEESSVLERYGSSPELESYSLRNMQAYKVTSKRLLAPNWGVYAAHPHQNLIYELIPMGEIGEHMLESFSVVEFR